MSMSGAELEKEALDRLKERFESQGYEFLMNPPRSRLPDFLQSSPPNALAIGPNETVVVEAKRRRSKASDILLKILAQDISTRIGWRLLVVYVGETSNDIASFNRAEQVQIRHAIQDVRKIMLVSPSWIIMATTWSIFESVARNLYAVGDSVAERALSPIQIVERLASDGYLDPNEAKRLRALISARNRAVHGDLTISAPTEDLHFMLDKADEINNASDISSLGFAG